MKILNTVFVVIISLFLLISCGSGDYKLKVEWEDGSDSDSEAIIEGEDEESNGNEESEDTDGGIEYLEADDDYKKDRYFMGTYQFLDNIYYNSTYPEVCAYGLPLTVRLYSHDDVIDFENSSGDLVWIADIYEDETFDYEIGFLNRFGNPSIELICTCFIEDSYYYYRNEQIKCGCEPSNDDINCAVFYEKIEN